MATTALSAGVQQIYRTGLLQSSLTPDALTQASSGQLNTLIASNVALQQIATLFGTGATITPPTDSAFLSSDGFDTLLQQITAPGASSETTSADPFLTAISNDLTSALNSAVARFFPATPTTSGQINLLA